MNVELTRIIVDGARWHSDDAVWEDSTKDIVMKSDALFRTMHVSVGESAIAMNFRNLRIAVLTGLGL